jgi:hypothetical protein
MLEQVRAQSLAVASSLGYPVNINLPALDISDSVPTLAEAKERLLVLYAVVSFSYGLGREDAINWLKQEGLFDDLAPSELVFLTGQTTRAQKNSMQWRVEGIWALAWAVSIHETLDFSDSCSDSFIAMLPDLKRGESSRSLSNLRMRNFEDIVAKCDLAYCLHWGAREAELSGNPIPRAVPINVILERRRALEWLVSDQDWDEVNLDT